VIVPITKTLPSTGARIASCHRNIQWSSCSPSRRGTLCEAKNLRVHRSPPIVEQDRLPGRGDGRTTQQRSCFDRVDHAWHDCVARG
jgi:hypothetical protein